MRVFWIALLTAGFAAADTDERALEWLRKAQAQAGGVEKLSAVPDVRIEREMRSVAAGMTATQVVHYVPPSALRQETAMPFGKMTIFVNPDGGWMNGPQGQMDMPPPQLKQARGELFRLREALLLADRLEDREVRFGRETEDEGRKAVVLEVISTDGQETVEVWIDQESGDLYKIGYEGVVLAGSPPRVEERYSDFRQTGGLRIPYKTAIFQNGTLLTDATVVEVAVNTGASEQELAAKP